MSRFLPSCLSCLLVLAACGNDLKTKEKVQAAIVERLQKHSGLDMNSMDVSTTNVTFEKDLAYATVSFHSKGDPNVTSGMSMRYTLEARDGKWQVTKVGDSASHSVPATLPAGHPSVDPSSSIDPSMNPGAKPANPHLPAPNQ